MKKFIIHFLGLDKYVEGMVGSSITNQSLRFTNELNRVSTRLSNLNQVIDKNYFSITKVDDKFLALEAFFNLEYFENEELGYKKGSGIEGSTVKRVKELK